MKRPGVPLRASSRADRWVRYRRTWFCGEIATLSAGSKREAVMPKRPDTCGFNHVATMTADLDRYLQFYGDVFGAEVVSITQARGDHPRMAIVNMGGDG